MKIKKFTKTGSWHESCGVKNQDYFCSVETKECIAVMLADGASACVKAAEGARLSCEAVKYVIENEGKAFFHYPKEKIAWLLKEQILYWIENHKEAAEEITDYGTTFLLAFMEKKNGRTVLINLGDGAILTTSEKGFSYLLKPKRYGSNPCLITTKEVMKAIKIAVVNVPIGRTILLCSDGFLFALPDVIKTGCRLEDWEMLDKTLVNVQTPDDTSYIVLRR